jgi:hypothetical protein
MLIEKVYAKAVVSKIYIMVSPQPVKDFIVLPPS